MTTAIEQTMRLLSSRERGYILSTRCIVSSPNGGSMITQWKDDTSVENIIISFRLKVAEGRYLLYKKGDEHPLAPNRLIQDFITGPLTCFYIIPLNLTTTLVEEYSYFRVENPHVSMLEYLPIFMETTHSHIFSYIFGIDIIDQFDTTIISNEMILLWNRHPNATGHHWTVIKKHFIEGTPVIYHLTDADISALIIRGRVRPLECCPDELSIRYDEETKTVFYFEQVTGIIEKMYVYEQCIKCDRCLPGNFVESYCTECFTLNRLRNMRNPPINLGFQTYNERIH